MADKKQPGEGPRTDLPPKKIPYDEDYFGSGEEEGVVREREASPEPAPEADDKPTGPSGPKAA